jgi:signal transduction histidine kinase
MSSRYISDISTESILSGLHDSEFVSQAGMKNTFPLLEHPLWFRFIVNNKSGEQLYLEVGEPSVNDIVLYSKRADGKFDIKTAGYFTKYKKRDILTNNYLFELNSENQEAGTYYLNIRMRYKETITIPLSVGSLQSFLERNHRYDITAGIFYGYMLLVVIFNIIMFVYTRDLSYLYFSLHAAMAAIWVANYYGHTFEFLWKNAPGLNRFTPAITATSSIFVILFSRIFLRTKDYVPTLHKGLYILLGLFGAVIILNILDKYYWSLVTIEFTAFTMCIYLTSLAFVVYRRGFTPSIIYSFALITFFAGIIVFLLQINGFLPANIFTRNTVPIGLGLEIGFISIAMGNRLRFYRVEKKKNQLQLIASYEENQRLLINLREQELKSLTDALDAQEKERHRISLDLHDRLGSMLSTVKMYFSTIEDSLKHAQDERLEKYYKAVSLIDQACDEVRRISYDIISTGNVEFSLVHSLQETVKDINEAGYLKINLFTIGMKERLDKAVEIMLYRIMQELINNILKHSHAKEVTIQLNQTASNLNVLIEDNGNGFDPDTAKAKGGMGLRNIELRINKINGKYHIDSGKGNGTTTIIDIPLSEYGEEVADN